jgi:amidase
MCKACDYTIHGRQHHFGWYNSFDPALRVAPGSTIEFECRDSSAGQLTPDSTVESVTALDFSKINPVSGPIFVEGAEPGDALKVTIEGFKPSGFGWTANIPGFGLLADQFTDPALTIWTYDPNSLEPAAFGQHGRVPLKPFAGTIGNALAEPGHHSVVPPRRVGGNLDIRDLSAGTTLYLPVEVAGALFSVGDTHAAQGDGEVCGTAVECGTTTELTVHVAAHPALPSVHAVTPTERITFGFDADLNAATDAALDDLVTWVAADHALDRSTALALLSSCADLRVTQIANGTWGVHAVLRHTALRRG